MITQLLALAPQEYVQSIDPDVHAAIIKLIIAYTLAGAFVFTAIVTCLSLIGVVKFSEPGQQGKLFLILIVEIVVAGVGYFTDLIKFNPKQVQQQVQVPIAEKAMEQHEDEKARVGAEIKVLAAELKPGMQSSGGQQQSVNRLETLAQQLQTKPATTTTESGPR